MAVFMENFLELVRLHSIILLVAFFIMGDMFFGTLRAIKQRCFNSCVGIDGAIRKISMIAALVFLVIVDSAVHINLVSYVPPEVLQAIGIETVGLTELFGLLFAAYEAVSILKNMAICGLPIKKIETAVRAFLGKYTDELPDAE